MRRNVPVAFLQMEKCVKNMDIPFIRKQISVVLYFSKGQGKRGGFEPVLPHSGLTWWAGKD